MKQQSGFTLIEISIVLVIIGLLAGGILKGQQMIENAKYKAFVKEIESYSVAVYNFKDIYRYYPGDFPFATKKFSIPGTTIYDGNGNGDIYGGWCTTPITEESCLVWQHLVASGLLSGDPNIPATLRQTPIGGVFQSISMGAWGNGKFTPKLLMQSIPGDVAQRYDDEFDDGNALTGRASCYTGGGPQSVVPCTSADSNGHYKTDSTYNLFIEL